MRVHELLDNLPAPNELTDSQDYEVVIEDADGVRSAVRSVEYDHNEKQVVIQA